MKGGVRARVFVIRVAFTCLGGLVSFTLFRMKKVKSSGKWLSLFGKTKSLFFGRAIKVLSLFWGPIRAASGSKCRLPS